MLERNILSHLKLALLLSLLASSLLLHARLVPGHQPHSSGSNIPLASVEYAAAMAAIVGGVWEYYSGYNDLRHTRAFLSAVRLAHIFTPVLQDVLTRRVDLISSSWG